LEGLRDGMITMLSQTSFNGQWQTAHSYADFVGDIVGIMEWNTTYANEWYVPTRDLHNIIIDYYGDDRGISQVLIQTCTLMLLAGRTAEQELGAIVYPIEVIQAPVFLDELQDYYMGGINDMAAWTQIVWDSSIQMALNGPEYCHIERNPMNIYCNGTEKSINHGLGPYPHEKVTEMKRIFFDEHMKEDLGIKNLLDFANEIIQVDQVENGVYFKVEDLHFGETKSVKKRQEKASIQPDITLTLSKPYANLGQSLYVADINQDGLDDLLIGAPGYLEPGHKNQGCVFIMTDIEGNYGVDVFDFPKICAEENNHYGRFGHSIATSKLSGATDGLDFIIIGSPTSGTKTKQYNGCVSYYVINENFDYFGSTCDNPVNGTANMGSTLTILENDDLLISGIYGEISGLAPAQTRQAGVVHKEDGSANFYGTKGYSWTGHHIEDLGDNRLAISAHMAKLNYVINTGGEVKIVDYDLNEILTIPNRELHSDQFGYSMIATDLMIDGEVTPCLVIGAPTASYGVHTNAGAVHIFDSIYFTYLGKMHADRALARFGRSFTQSEDYVFIGAPRYHEEGNALREEGAIFALSKNKDLPRDDITAICTENNSSPCINDWMDMKFTPPNGQERTMFGHQIKTLKRGQDTYLAISAPRDNTWAMQGGAVFLYKI